MKSLLIALALAFMSFSAQAQILTLDKNGSSITFSGTHAGKAFTGTFEKWDADIVLDQNNLDKSHAKVTIDLSSAVTGDKMYDGTLPQADWFDIKNTPTATFESTSVLSGVAGYMMTGILDLRGVKKEVSFNFSFAKSMPPFAVATIPLKRMDFNIGAKSDPKAEWVSETIDVQLNLKTKTAQ